MKTKIKCFVCDTQYQDNNANDPNHAIYLGYLEGRNKYVDTHVFVHNNPQCISKAKKQGILDKGKSYKKCIVCSHRINLSEKTLKDGSKIFQNGYLVDTNHWVHLPFRSTPSLSKFIVSNCYEKAFGHTIYPPEDILLKREEILNKFSKILNKSKQETRKNETILKKEGEELNIDTNNSKKSEYQTLDEVEENDEKEIGIQDGGKMQTKIESEAFAFFAILTILILLFLIIFY